MAKMRGHKVRCRCVGCCPATRKRGMRALKKNPRKRAFGVSRKRDRRLRSGVTLRGLQPGWYLLKYADGGPDREIFYATKAIVRAVSDMMMQDGRPLRELSWIGGARNENPLVRQVGQRDAAPRKRVKWSAAQKREMARDLAQKYGITRAAAAKQIRQDERDQNTYENPKRRPPLSMVAGGPDRGTGEVTCSACGDHAVFRWADPCMDAVKARHRAAVTHKCSCGRKARPRHASNGMGRDWIACDRCLGTIKQLNPGARDLPQPVSRGFEDAEVPIRCRHCDRLLGVGSAGTPPVECTKCSETVTKARKTYRRNPGKPVCPNCGQWQSPGRNGHLDCFNECAHRGFAPKVKTLRGFSTDDSTLDFKFPNTED